MKCYSEMTKFEINQEIAVIDGGYLGHCENEYAPNQVSVSTRDGFYVERDYCGNAGDCQHLVLEYKVSITWTGSYWLSVAPLSFPRECSWATERDEDTPMAAMITILKMHKVMKGSLSEDL